MRKRKQKQKTAAINEGIKNKKKASMVDTAYMVEEKQTSNYFEEVSCVRFTFQLKHFTHFSEQEEAAYSITASLHHQRSTPNLRLWMSFQRLLEFEFKRTCRL